MIDRHQQAITDVREALSRLESLREAHQHEVDLCFDTTPFANLLLAIEGMELWVEDELAMTEEERANHC